MNFCTKMRDSAILINFREVSRNFYFMLKNSHENKSCDTFEICLISRVLF